jgi:hypothetical protein
VTALVVWALLGGSTADEIDRLEGHRVTIDAGGSGYAIEDVAGEGPPLVGVVRREGADLLLVTAGGAAFRLTGPLAIPRIAGPGYKVWVTGAISPLTMSLRARRIGVLARPAAAPPAATR